MDLNDLKLFNLDLHQPFDPIASAHTGEYSPHRKTLQDWQRIAIQFISQEVPLVPGLFQVHFRCVAVRADQPNFSGSSLLLDQF